MIKVTFHALTTLIEQSSGVKRSKAVEMIDYEMRHYYKRVYNAKASPEIARTRIARPGSAAPSSSKGRSRSQDHPHRGRGGSGASSRLGSSRPPSSSYFTRPNNSSSRATPIIDDHLVRKTAEEGRLSRNKSQSHVELSSERAIAAQRRGRPIQSSSSRLKHRHRPKVRV